MLRDKIKADFKEAFKAREEVRLSVLKMVQSEIGNAEINKRAKLMKGGASPPASPRGEGLGGQAENIESLSVLNDEEVLQVVSREIKKEKIRWKCMRKRKGWNWPKEKKRKWRS